MLLSSMVFWSSCEYLNDNFSQQSVLAALYRENAGTDEILKRQKKKFMF